MITVSNYSTFQQAYDYFNTKLFEGKLPDCMITMQRGKAYKGYYWAEKFIGRDGSKTVAEIALNPDLFDGRTDKDILSTLVHEQVHCWQYEYGKAPRKSYHDKQWTTKMKEIGLYPSTTAEEGGKETGQSVSHYIIKDSLFDKHCDNLITEGFKLEWNSDKSDPKKKKAKPTRAKHTCPLCANQAMAKPTMRLACGDCSTENDIVYMDIEELESSND